MNRILVYLVLLFAFLSTAQETKTMNVMSQKHQNSKALIIGVSEYQHISGLKYAHRDAAEFAKFLKENDGWGLPEENIQVLTNDEAKQGDILIGLQWLLDVSAPGEEVVFYFSGHGDVEKVGEEKKGFLLAHDSPKNNYPIGGTLEISLLDSVLVQLMKKDVKIWMVIDACRSGNLAGGMSGKSQTTEALAKQWNNQIRMLSAQPDQLSYEDTLWGGGRGVFSYYLVKGMAGYANANNDMKITLSELENYLGNNISVQTNYTQQPHIEGPNKFSLNVSNPDQVQMKNFENDRIEGELSLAMVSKSGEFVISEECMEGSQLFSEKLKLGLTSKSFHQISASWNKLASCTKDNVPLQLKYQYMRSLINQINEVVNLSLTGEKLGLQQDLKYGIRLIAELNDLNKGVHYIGKDHFQRVNHYLKSVLYTLYTENYISEIQFPYLIEVQQDDPENYDWMDEKGFEDELEFNSIENVKILEAKQVEGGSTWLKFESTFFETYDVLAAIDYYLNGTYHLYAIVEGDTLLISSKTTEQKKPEKNVTSWNFDKRHSELMLQKLAEDCAAESSAAYLYYSRAILYNRLKNNDSALKMLDSCMALSPKWLNPLYAKGALLRTERQNKEAIETFERVFQLEPLYRDFECVDCFFMGLVNLYLKEDMKDKIEPAIDEWLQMRKDEKSRWDLYFQLLSDPSASRSQKKFWLKKMEMIQQTTVEDQFRWIYADLSVNQKKYKDKEVVEFTHFLLKKISEGNQSAKRFFESAEEVRSSQAKSRILQDYFPDGRSFTYTDSIDLIESVAILVEEQNYNHLFNQKELSQEYFMLTGLLRLKDLNWYYEWTDLLLQRKRNDIELLDLIFENGPFTDHYQIIKKDQVIIAELKAQLESPEELDRKEIEYTISDMEQYLEDLNYDDVGYNFAITFGYDPELFNQHYRPLYSSKFLYLFLNSISERWGFQDESRLKEKCSTYQDEELLQKIRQMMAEFYYQP
jgi:uncharacterized caspase-like protein